MYKTRFELFTLLLSEALHGFSSSYPKNVDALFDVFDPNVASMINMGEDEPVIKKVKDYISYLYFGGVKPFWFQKS